MTTILFIMIFLLILLLATLAFLQQRSIIQEREQWHKERKDLYNRIQASSYIEYKSLEKETKEKKEEEPPIEYV